MRACDGWPDQPCTWTRCLTTDTCQNPTGPAGKDYGIDPTGAVIVETEGARILSVELVEEP